VLAKRIADESAPTEQVSASLERRPNPLYRIPFERQHIEPAGPSRIMRMPRQP
jgi:hypothetical protein